MRSGGILQYSHSVQVERVSFQVDSASRIPPRADHSAVLAINSREPERRELSSHERKQARGPERHGNDPNHLHEPAAEKWVTFMWVSNEWLPPPKLLISQTFNLDSSLFFPPSALRRWCTCSSRSRWVSDAGGWINRLRTPLGWTGEAAESADTLSSDTFIH